MQSKKANLVGGWRRPHNEINEELHNSYTSPNIIWAIKSRKIKWVGHVAHMGEREIHTNYWSENLKERDHL